MWLGGLGHRSSTPPLPTPSPDILKTSAQASSCSRELPWKLPPPQHWRLPLGPHGNQGEGLRLGWGRGEEWAEWGCRSPRTLGREGAVFLLCLGRKVGRPMPLP